MSGTGSFLPILHKQAYPQKNAVAIPPPTVTAVKTISSPSIGGTALVISGSNLLPFSPTISGLTPNGGGAWTITTQGPHGLTNGSSVTISGITGFTTNNNLNGSRNITSVPTANTFTFAQGGAPGTGNYISNSGLVESATPRKPIVQFTQGTTVLNGKVLSSFSDSLIVQIPHGITGNCGITVATPAGTSTPAVNFNYFLSYAATPSSVYDATQDPAMAIAALKPGEIWDGGGGIYYTNGITITQPCTIQNATIINPDYWVEYTPRSLIGKDGVDTDSRQKLFVGSAGSLEPNIPISAMIITSQLSTNIYINTVNVTISSNSFYNNNPVVLAGVTGFSSTYPTISALSVSNISPFTCTATTTTNHGLQTNSQITLSGITGFTTNSNLNGLRTITVTSATTFTFNAAASPGTGTYSVSPSPGTIAATSLVNNIINDEHIITVISSGSGSMVVQFTFKSILPTTGSFTAANIATLSLSDKVILIASKDPSNYPVDGVSHPPPGLVDIRNPPLEINAVGRGLYGAGRTTIKSLSTYVGKDALLADVTYCAVEMTTESSIDSIKIPASGLSASLIPSSPIKFVTGNYTVRGLSAYGILDGIYPGTFANGTLKITNIAGAIASPLNPSLADAVVSQVAPLPSNVSGYWFYLENTNSNIFAKCMNNNSIYNFGLPPQNGRLDSGITGVAGSNIIYDKNIRASKIHNQVTWSPSTPSKIFDPDISEVDLWKTVRGKHIPDGAYIGAVDTSTPKNFTLVNSGGGNISLEDVMVLPTSQSPLTIYIGGDQGALAVDAIGTPYDAASLTILDPEILLIHQGKIVNGPNLTSGYVSQVHPGMGFSIVNNKGKALPVLGDGTCYLVCIADPTALHNVNVTKNSSTIRDDFIASGDHGAPVMNNNSGIIMGYVGTVTIDSVLGNSFQLVTNSVTPTPITYTQANGTINIIVGGTYHGDGTSGSSVQASAPNFIAAPAIASGDVNKMVRGLNIPFPTYISSVVTTGSIRGFYMTNGATIPKITTPNDVVSTVYLVKETIPLNSYIGAIDSSNSSFQLVDANDKPVNLLADLNNTDSIVVGPAKSQINMYNINTYGNSFNSYYMPRMVSGYGFNLVSVDSVYVNSCKARYVNGDGLAVFLSQGNSEFGNCSSIHVNSFAADNAGRCIMSIGAIDDRVGYNFFTDINMGYNSGLAGFDFESDLPFVGVGYLDFARCVLSSGFHLITSVLGPMNLIDCDMTSGFWYYDSLMDFKIKMIGGSYNAGISGYGIYAAGAMRIIGGNVEFENVRFYRNKNTFSIDPSQDGNGAPSSGLHSYMDELLLEDGTWHTDVSHPGARLEFRGSIQTNNFPIHDPDMATPQTIRTPISFVPQIPNAGLVPLPQLSTLDSTAFAYNNTEVPIYTLENITGRTWIAKTVKPHKFKAGIYVTIASSGGVNSQFNNSWGIVSVPTENSFIFTTNFDLSAGPYTGATPSYLGTAKIPLSSTVVTSVDIQPSVKNPTTLPLWYETQNGGWAGIGLGGTILPDNSLLDATGSTANAAIITAEYTGASIPMQVISNVSLGILSTSSVPVAILTFTTANSNSVPSTFISQNSFVYITGLSKSATIPDGIYQVAEVTLSALVVPTILSISIICPSASAAGGVTGYVMANNYITTANTNGTGINTTASIAFTGSIVTSVSLTSGNEVISVPSGSTSSLPSSIVAATPAYYVYILNGTGVLDSNNTLIESYNSVTPNSITLTKAPTQSGVATIVITTDTMTAYVKNNPVTGTNIPFGSYVGDITISGTNKIGFRLVDGNGNISIPQNTIDKVYFGDFLNFFNTNYPSTTPSSVVLQTTDVRFPHIPYFLGLKRTHTFTDNLGNPIILGDSTSSQIFDPKVVKSTTHTNGENGTIVRGDLSSDFIVDSAINSNQIGHYVNGSNIPDYSYVGSVYDDPVKGLGFYLVNNYATPSAVYPIGLVDTISIAGDTGTMVTGTNIPFGSYVGRINVDPIKGNSFTLVDYTGFTIKPTGNVSSVKLGGGLISVELNSGPRNIKTIGSPTLHKNLSGLSVVTEKRNVDLYINTITQTPISVTPNSYSMVVPDAREIYPGQSVTGQGITSGVGTVYSVILGAGTTGQVILKPISGTLASGTPYLFTDIVDSNISTGEIHEVHAMPGLGGVGYDTSIIDSFVTTADLGLPVSGANIPLNSIINSVFIGIPPVSNSFNMYNPAGDLATPNGSLSKVMIGGRIDILSKNSVKEIKSKDATPVTIGTTILGTFNPGRLAYLTVTANSSEVLDTLIDVADEGSLIWLSTDGPTNSDVDFDINNLLSVTPANNPIGYTYNPVITGIEFPIGVGSSRSDSVNVYVGAVNPGVSFVMVDIKGIPVIPSLTAMDDIINNLVLFTDGVIPITAYIGGDMYKTVADPDGYIPIPAYIHADPMLTDSSFEIIDSINSNGNGVVVNSAMIATPNYIITGARLDSTYGIANDFKIYDSSITVSDIGTQVSGIGIPAGALVASPITAGYYFTIKDNSGITLHLTQNISSFTLGDDTGSLVGGTNIRPGTYVGNKRLDLIPARFAPVFSDGTASAPLGPLDSIIIGGRNDSVGSDPGSSSITDGAIAVGRIDTASVVNKNNGFPLINSGNPVSLVSFGAMTPSSGNIIVTITATPAYTWVAGEPVYIQGVSALTSALTSTGTVVSLPPIKTAIPDGWYTILAPSSNTFRINAWRNITPIWISTATTVSAGVYSYDMVIKKTDANLITTGYTVNDIITATASSPLTGGVITSLAAISGDPHNYWKVTFTCNKATLLPISSTLGYYTFKAPTSGAITFSLATPASSVYATAGTNTIGDSSLVRASDNNKSVTLFSDTSGTTPISGYSDVYYIGSPLVDATTFTLLDRYGKPVNLKLPGITTLYIRIGSDKGSIVVDRDGYIPSTIYNPSSSSSDSYVGNIVPNASFTLVDATPSEIKPSGSIKSLVILSGRSDTLVSAPAITFPRATTPTVAANGIPINNNTGSPSSWLTVSPLPAVTAANLATDLSTYGTIYLVDPLVSIASDAGSLISGPSIPFGTTILTANQAQSTSPIGYANTLTLALSGIMITAINIGSGTSPVITLSATGSWKGGNQVVVYGLGRYGIDNTTYTMTHTGDTPGSFQITINIPSSILSAQLRNQSIPVSGLVPTMNIYSIQVISWTPSTSTIPTYTAYDVSLRLYVKGSSVPWGTTNQFVYIWGLNGKSIPQGLYQITGSALDPTTTPSSYYFTITMKVFGYSNIPTTSGNVVGFVTVGMPAWSPSPLSYSSTDTGITNGNITVGGRLDSFGNDGTSSIVYDSKVVASDSGLTVWAPSIGTDPYYFIGKVTTGSFYLQDGAGNDIIPKSAFSSMIIGGRSDGLKFKVDSFGNTQIYDTKLKGSDVGALVTGYLDHATPIPLNSYIGSISYPSFNLVDNYNNPVYLNPNLKLTSINITKGKTYIIDKNILQKDKGSFVVGKNIPSGGSFMVGKVINRFELVDSNNIAPVTPLGLVGIGYLYNPSTRATRIDSISLLEENRVDIVTWTAPSQINDKNINVFDNGKYVTGVNIPVGSYVGPVNPGISFVLVDSNGSPQTRVSNINTGFNIIIGSESSNIISNVNSLPSDKGSIFTGHNIPGRTDTVTWDSTGIQDQSTLLTDELLPIVQVNIPLGVKAYIPGGIFLAIEATSNTLKFYDTSSIVVGQPVTGPGITGGSASVSSVVGALVTLSATSPVTISGLTAGVYNFVGAKVAGGSATPSFNGTPPVYGSFRMVDMNNNLVTPLSGTYPKNQFDIVIGYSTVGGVDGSFEVLDANNSSVYFDSFNHVKDIDIWMDNGARAVFSYEFTYDHLKVTTTNTQTFTVLSGLSYRGTQSPNLRQFRNGGPIINDPINVPPMGAVVPSTGPALYGNTGTQGASISFMDCIFDDTAGTQGNIELYSFGATAPNDPSTVIAQQTASKVRAPKFTIDTVSISVSQTVTLIASALPSNSQFDYYIFNEAKSIYIKNLSQVTDFSMITDGYYQITKITNTYPDIRIQLSNRFSQITGSARTVDTSTANARGYVLLLNSVGNWPVNTPVYIDEFSATPYFSATPFSPTPASIAYGPDHTYLIDSSLQFSIKATAAASIPGSPYTLTFNPADIFKVNINQIVTGRGIVGSTGILSIDTGSYTVTLDSTKIRFLLPNIYNFISGVSIVPSDSSTTNVSALLSDATPNNLNITMTAL